MKEWRSKLTDAFEIDAIPTVNQTIQHLYGDVFSVEGKTPIPSSYELKARSSETQAWTNAQMGEQDETEPEAFSRVERSPYAEDAYMDTPKTLPFD